MGKYLIVLLFLFNIAFAKEPIRVAVIDTGLDLNDARFMPHLCLSGHADFTGTGINDTNGHATHVTGLIQRYAGNANYCLVIVKYYSEKATHWQNIFYMQEAINYAIFIGAKVVNISSGGDNPNPVEYNLIKNAKETTFIVAAGNEGKNIRMSDNYYFPASYNLNNIIVVGNLETDYTRNPHSNYGEGVVWEKGTDVLSTLPNGKIGMLTGSSMATAIRAGKYIHANY